MLQQAADCCTGTDSQAQSCHARLPVARMTISIPHSGVFHSAKSATVIRARAAQIPEAHPVHSAGGSKGAEPQTAAIAESAPVLASSLGSAVQSGGADDANATGMSWERGKCLVLGGHDDSSCQGAEVPPHTLRHVQGVGGDTRWALTLKPEGTDRRKGISEKNGLIPPTPTEF